MKQAYLDYIKFALAAGYKVAVTCDGEIDLKSSDSYKAIKEAAEATDMVNLVVRDVKAKKTVGVAAVIPGGDMEPDETVIDYTVTPHNTAWEKQYYA